MAITLLASRNDENRQTGISLIQTHGNSVYRPTSNAITRASQATEQGSQNNGGFIGGLGYLVEKISLGFLSGIEGIWDYTAGGIAKLFGADDWAERRFANDWVNYNHADEWFNPSSSWRVAGDVAGGIGTSLPALAGAAAGAAIIYFSGGALSSGGAKLILGSISAGIAGFGAAGNATKEAYRETGQLTGKEFGYGALSGATEAGVEFLTAGIGKGTGRIISSLGEKAVKEGAESVAKTVAKTGAKSIFKQLGEDFATEAFEEGLAEILSPVYQRMTYNPDAENASAQEIFYAAMVGGLSGMVMSGSSIGVNAGVNSTVNYFSGKKSKESGTYAGVIEAGRALADAEGKNDTNIEAFQSAQDTYNKLTESLKKNNGISTTEELLERVKAGNVTFEAKDLMYLGKLKRTNVIAHIHPYIERSAIGLVFNPENAAQRYAAFGMTDASGKPIRVTAEQILSGIDASLVEKAKAGTLTKSEAKTFAKSLRKALSENSTLATLAVAEATGGIMMDTRRIAESIINGENLANTADLNYLIEKGKPEEMQALGQALGIEDWSKVTIDELRTRVAEFNANGGISEFAEQSKRMRRALEQGAESAKPLPHLLRKNMQDGVYRYTSEDGSVNMAIFKEGDTYRLYDYDGGNISRALSVQDVNQVLKRFWTSGQTTTAKSMQFTEETNLARETTEIDAYAAENIPDYNSMSEPNKAAIRMTVRQARAHGLADAETLVFAKVAAKSGLNVIFDAERAFGDGAISGNTIYVNPNNSEARTYEVILGHEMFHKLFADGDKRAMQLFAEARELLEKSNPEKAKEVRERYKKFYKKLGADATTAHTISVEEVAAAGAEEVFRSADAWAYILSKEPSFADKVLSFFRKSAREYSSVQGLSAQARKFVRQYKALFESLAERNQGNNALSIALEGAGAKKMPVTNTETDSMHVTGDNDEEAPIVTNTDVDTDTRYALIGRTEDGRGIYRTNYPENTPKDVKQKDIVDLVQNVWSKKPIKLNLIVDGKEVPIEARFNPELTERSDLSKIAFGNRKGTASEKRITMNLSSDLYQIAEESHHVGSKTESGKDNAAHAGVTTWHYFLTDLVYVEAEGTEIECYMNIDVKQNDSGHWFYSFAIEKGSRPADVLSVVTDKSATTSTISITENAEKSNPSDEKSAKKSSKKRFALTENAETKVIHGYTLNKNAVVNEDLLEELRIYDPSAEVSPDGRITVYHRTSEESAAAIRKTGIMRAKEDALFFSSKSEGYASDYGDTVLTFKIPSTQLRINDIFEGEVHFDMPLKRSANGWAANVKAFLDESSRFALPETDSNGETLTEAQREYFADSKVLDENGNLLALYHGTPKENGEFYVFDNNKAKRKGGFGFASSGKGFYFTTKREAAEIYTRSGGRLLSVYVDIKNPYIVNGDIKEQISNDFGIDPLNVYLQEVRRILSSKGYDGIIQGKGDARIVVAYYPEQIKLTSNKNPTADPDVRFALPETDSTGAELTSDQRKYFDASKQLDSEGRLQVMYQGAPEEFFTFDKKKSKASNLYGRGFYFTNSADQSRHYGTVRGYYLNITNPLSATKKTISRMQMRKFLNAVAQNEDYSIENYGTYDVAEVLRSVYEGKSDFAMLYDVSLTAIGDLVEAVELFNEINGTEYDGFILDTESVIFRSEQAKLTSNAAPSSKPDTRYALKETSQAIEKYTEKQYNSFGWARHAEALTKTELDDLYSKIQARTTLRTFRQSSKGEAIIEVNKKPHTTLDVDNVFVFVKGTKNNFEITRVVRFAAETETEMEILKEKLYERGTCSDTYLALYQKEGITREYRRKNSPTFAAYREGRSNGETSRRTNQNNRGRAKYRSGYSLTVGEDGEIIERYALTGNEDIDALLSELYSDTNAVFDIEAILERGIPRKPGASMLTIGEMKKTIANNTHYQVFSKGKALEVIGRMSGTSDLSAKTRAKLADALWQGFNDCTDVESRQTFAHDMAEYIVATMVTEAKVENPDVMEAQERLSYLSTYIGRITFHPEYLSEIRHIADKAGLKKVLGRWGYKGKQGTRRIPMDVFACDIAREMPGMSALEDMHPVEAFMELDAMYERAREDVKDEWISAYWEATDADMLSIVAGIEADIMKAFETEGEQSKFSKLVEGRIEYYSTRAEFWKAEHDRIKGRDRILGLLVSKAQRIKDLKLGTYTNATQMQVDNFNKSIGKLSRIQYRGNFNVPGTRTILKELYDWYTNETVKTGILGVTDTTPGLYVQGVADTLEYLYSGTKGFSKEDLSTLYDVMTYFEHLMTDWNKVFRNGKLVEALPLAKRYVSIAQANEGVKVGLFAKISGSLYAETFSDPATLVRRMDYYERGFYTEIFEDLRDAATDAEIAEMRIMREYDEFLRSNKKYIEKASEELIEYRGQKIPKIQLIDLYMTMKRKHAWAGLAINGFRYTNLEGKVVRVPGFLPDEHISETALEAAITAQQAEIAKHFTEADRQYMAILEKGYNEDARKLKADRDIQRLGFSNASTDYYYPIRRAYTSKNVDAADAQAEYDRVTNSSFNKDIVKGAKQKLAIESADTRFRRHIHAVCQYAYLSPAIEAYNRLYNLDISGNPDDPISVRTASENVWAKGNKYFMKLISDIQGIPAGSSEGMAALGLIRGSYAKFQLGANPKVWLNQLSSIFASSSMLDADCITRGAFLSSEGIDQYCPLAELRSYDNTAAMAQGVLDKQGKARSKAGRAMGKVSKFSDLLMSPIGMMDRFVVCRIFGACQVQVEKNGGAKVGTEANKIEAGKLLEKVILETQQNSIATERSAAMRSGNEILRTLTMFTADSMKVMGKVIDAFGEISVLHSKIKAATDPDVKAELKARLKVAKRNARKATTALVLTAVFMAGIAQLFRWLYDKEQKEDETVAQTMIVDAVGNLFGGLPLIKDVYARIFEGYGFDNYAYSSINDLLDSAINLFDTAGSIIGGEATSQDVARGIKNLSYSIGQMTGLPVRNVYNVFYGLTKRFSPETAYKIDNVFYEKNYKNDFYKAIENEDAETASFILSLLYNERMGTDMSEAVHSELYSLSAKGYKVLPTSAPNSITVEGVEYELNAAQQAAVRGSYSASQASLEKLFTKEKYKKLSEEMKAEAVNYVYELHYNMALEDALGIDRGNAVLISSVIGAENLAMLHVATKGLTSDTDKLGNAISGSKRKKVVAAINQLDVSSEQKLLLICAKGYALKDGDLRGLSAERAKKLLLRYILRMGKLNKQQKAELAALCGFEVRNGRIMLKTPS